LNWFATLVKAVSSLPPRAVMALTAATETRMAMSAYSIAVAPDCRPPARRTMKPAGRGRPSGLQEIGTVMNRFYLSWFDTAVNVLVSLVPRVVIAAIAATAIRAAMRPYSMAVAPDSSRAKRLKRVFMVVVLLS
jgi:hypothetical protein